ncbi:MAG: BatA domain-containing protein, partial [Prolixibacteraceae bacterium]|nr:BatA domain-containing protein [Prolixibacteraceae bacterium]
MKFIYPAFLYSLIAIAIPILIHLFSFRRFKTVYFSHVSFLKEIKKESEKKTHPKQLLILIARILTIVFLVFAFAQPYIPDNLADDGKRSDLVAIYIDNSFSMNALSEKGRLLELARNKAVEIARSYPAGTQFKLYTNELHPKHQYLFNSEQLIREVSDIEIAPEVLPLSLINNRFEIHNQSSEEFTRGTIYFISDFQKNITDPENFN